jgi:hypothetical protein
LRMRWGITGRLPESNPRLTRPRRPHRVNKSQPF